MRNEVALAQWDADERELARWADALLQKLDLMGVGIDIARQLLVDYQNGGQCLCGSDCIYRRMAAVIP